MYLFETSIGEVFRPRPRPPARPQPPPKEGWVTKDGHRRFCGSPSGRAVQCDLELKIRFRRSFEEFLQEVENAYGRWVSRSTARMLVKKLQKDLKQWHEEMLYFTVLENDPLVLVVGLYYHKSNGSWLGNDSSLRQWRRLIDI